MLFHFIKAHWRTVLGVVALIGLVIACMPASLRTRLWEGWKRFGHALGNFQARVLLTLIYYVLVLPFGLAVRLFSDTMHLKKRPGKWFDHPPLPNTLEEARRQG
jgi:hypothetical protein